MRKSRKHRKYKYKKYAKVRKKKSAFGSKFFWFSFLFSIALGVMFYFGVFSSVFQIKEIKVSGNTKLSIENIESIIFEGINTKIAFFESKSIFLTDLNKINEKIRQEFPQIAQIKLKREFPGVVSAQVEERKPVAVFCLALQSSPFAEGLDLEEQEEVEDCFLIDKNGVIFEKISEVNKFLIIKNLDSKINLELGKNIIEENLLSEILKIENKLKKDLEIKVEEISIISEERLNVKTIEEWSVYFNPKKDINWQLAKLSLVLKERIPPEKRKNLEYIDLRFEKIYIYPETYQE